MFPLIPHFAPALFVFTPFNQRYQARFVAQGYDDMQSIRGCLTAEDLDAIGVDDASHREQLLKAATATVTWPAGAILEETSVVDRNSTSPAPSDASSTSTSTPKPPAGARGKVMMPGLGGATAAAVAALAANKRLSAPTGEGGPAAAPPTGAEDAKTRPVSSMPALAGGAAAVPPAKTSPKVSPRVSPKPAVRSAA